MTRHPSFINLHHLMFVQVAGFGTAWRAWLDIVSQQRYTRYQWHARSMRTHQFDDLAGVLLHHRTQNGANQ